MLGESKTLAWEFAMVPHRLHALVLYCGKGSNISNTFFPALKSNVGFQYWNSQNANRKDPDQTASSEAV